MKHIAAYALLLLGGNEAPTAAQVEKVVKDSGATADKEKITALCAALEGKPFHELVEQGLKTLGSMGGSAAPAGAPAAAAKAEEAAPVEEEPEEDVDMAGMFGDDDDY